MPQASALCTSAEVRALACINLCHSCSWESVSMTCSSCVTLSIRSTWRSLTNNAFWKPLVTLGLQLRSLHSPMRSPLLLEERQVLRPSSLSVSSLVSASSCFTCSSILSSSPWLSGIPNVSQTRPKSAVVHAAVPKIASSAARATSLQRLREPLLGYLSQQLRSKKTVMCGTRAMPLQDHPWAHRRLNRFLADFSLHTSSAPLVESFVAWFTWFGQLSPFMVPLRLKSTLTSSSSWVKSLTHTGGIKQIESISVLEELQQRLMLKMMKLTSLTQRFRKKFLLSMKLFRLAQDAKNNGISRKPSTLGSVPISNGLLKTNAQSIAWPARKSSQFPKTSSTLASINSLELIKALNTSRRSCSERTKQSKDGDK